MQIINIMPPKKPKLTAMEVVNQKLRELKKSEVKPPLTTEQKEAEDKKKKAKAKEYRDKRAILTKHERERAKEKIKVPNVTTKYQENAAIANEEAIRKLFRRIIELPDEEYIFEMQDFFINHPLGRKTEEMFGVIKVLPTSLYKDLATSHINQDQSFNLFWEKYISRSNVLLDMAEKKDEIESLSFPVRKPRGPVYHYPQQIRKNKVEPRQPGYTKVKKVDDEGHVIETIEPEAKPKDAKRPFDDKSKYLLSIRSFDNCLKEKRITVIRDVTEVFITPTPTSSEEKKRLLESIIKATGNSETRIEKNVTWYSVDENLAPFLCTTDRIWMDESKSIMAILPDKRRIFFKIGYLSRDGTFFEQDRDHFIKERDYINTLRQTRDGEIGGILGSKISPEIENFAIDFLSNSLSNVAIDVRQYQNTDKDGYNYKAIQKMIESADRKTIKLFENLAKITVFLQNPDSIFAQRIREEFYIPEILSTLTDEEKLPEVFDDPNQNIKLANDHILKQIKAEVKRIATLLYKKKNSTVSVPTLPLQVIKPLYKVRPWKTPCENKLKGDVKNSDVFYYTDDDGKVYCLLISDMYKQIKEGKVPYNPITGKIINPDVIKRFRELYDFKFNPNDYTVVETPTPDKPSSNISKRPPAPQEKIKKHIAPWLLKTIRDNIKGCEKELTGEKCKDNYDETDDETIVEGKLEEESEQESEQESDQESEQESEEELEEEIKPKPPKTKSVESLFGTSSSDPKFESEIDTDNESEDSDVSSSSDHSPRYRFVIKEGKICQYCEKKITKNYLKKCLKTKIRDNEDEDKTIWFCTFECFEKYKFPCYKNKIRNGRKGGRFGSSEREKNKIKNGRKGGWFGTRER